MKFLSVLLIALSVSACHGIKQQQDLRKSPCAGAPCSGKLQPIPNAAVKA